MGYFLPYQERWILDDAPLKLYEKSRRTGITFATSYRCIRKCLRALSGSGFTQWVSSRDELTAREFIVDYVAMWARRANRIAREIAAGLDGECAEVVDEKHGISALVVRFRNGSRIVSLSSNPMAFAGKGGDVLIDEMDLHENQATLYAMAYPCVTWGNQLEIVSAYSADGSEHTEFARLCRLARNGNPMHFSFHRTTLDDAIREGFVAKVNSVKAARKQPIQSEEEFRETIRRGCLTRNAYESQYCCIPNRAGGEQLISSATLRAACSGPEAARFDLVGDGGGAGGGAAGEIDAACLPYISCSFWREVLSEGRYALGWDIARTGDISSLWINRCEEGGVQVLAALITMRNCRFESQRRIVETILDAFPEAVGCGDSTGLGMACCEALNVRYPDRFRGVNFAASKIALGTRMQSVFERGLQKLPSDAPEIAADLAGIRKGVASGGRLIFTESRNELLPASHCDLAWSAALALFTTALFDGDGICRMEGAGDGNETGLGIGTGTEFGLKRYASGYDRPGDSEDE